MQRGHDPRRMEAVDICCLSRAVIIGGGSSYSPHPWMKMSLAVHPPCENSLVQKRTGFLSRILDCIGLLSKDFERKSSGYRSALHSIPLIATVIRGIDFQFHILERFSIHNQSYVFDPDP